MPPEEGYLRLTSDPYIHTHALNTLGCTYNMHTLMHTQRKEGGGRASVVQAGWVEHQAQGIRPFRSVSPGLTRGPHSEEWVDSLFNAHSLKSVSVQ